MIARDDLLLPGDSLRCRFSWMGEWESVTVEEIRVRDLRGGVPQEIAVPAVLRSALCGRDIWLAFDDGRWAYSDQIEGGVWAEESLGIIRQGDLVKYESPYSDVERVAIVEEILLGDIPSPAATWSALQGTSVVFGNGLCAPGERVSPASIADFSYTAPA